MLKKPAELIEKDGLIRVGIYSSIVVAKAITETLTQPSKFLGWARPLLLLDWSSHADT